MNYQNPTKQVLADSKEVALSVREQIMEMEETWQAWNSAGFKEAKAGGLGKLIMESIMIPTMKQDLADLEDLSIEHPSFVDEMIKKQTLAVLLLQAYSKMQRISTKIHQLKILELTQQNDKLISEAADNAIKLARLTPEKK